MPSVSDYDLIIVDEAHRGYILDKDMSEDEINYRNQDDFVSKYRYVIEYFDAIKVALTATPAIHTSEIFGSPVFEYSYRQAVIEGFLVDHDAPHHLKTKLSRDGIVFEKDEVVLIYDTVTGELLNSDKLADELRFDLEKFNKDVIAPKFNRAVLEEICLGIDLDGEGKTLIFAVNNDHADLIVKTLREILEPKGIDHKAVMKITGKIGDKKHVLQEIKNFKNEINPSIVVTVDLLTTGIDVPKITSLVFLRRVKSRILFEQMLGRATRLCPDIGKTHFEIYDPVDIYATLQDVSTMKPVVSSESATFDDLLNGLEKLDTAEQTKNQIDLIVAKMRRKSRNMSDIQKDHFKSITGGKDPVQFMDHLSTLNTDDSKKMIFDKQELFQILNEGGHSKNRGIPVSNKEDEIVSHTRGYGKGLKPQDYIEQFALFIRDNKDKIEALNLVCTKPSDLTRSGLRSLRLELDRNNFSEIQLNSALNAMKNEDITADIITIIRSQAVGSELLSHEERIKKAVKKLKQAHTFSKMELNWLGRIETHLMNESILDEETFEQGAFKTKGGFLQINKIFNDKLKDYIIELNQYLYDDGGKAA